MNHNILIDRLILYQHSRLMSKCYSSRFLKENLSYFLFSPFLWRNNIESSVQHQNHHCPPGMWHSLLSIGRTLWYSSSNMHPRVVSSWEFCHLLYTLSRSLTILGHGRPKMFIQLIMANTDLLSHISAWPSASWRTLHTFVGILLTR